MIAFVSVCVWRSRHGGDMVEIWFDFFYSRVAYNLLIAFRIFTKCDSDYDVLCREKCHESMLNA